MKRIYKYPVTPYPFVLELPQEARVLTVQVQGKEPKMWVIVDPEKQTELRAFIVIGTGHDIDEQLEKNLSFIGTFQMKRGALIFHLFEIIGASKDRIVDHVRNATQPAMNSWFSDN